jgi:hypothetical protein
LRGIPEFIDALRAEQRGVKVVTREQPMSAVAGVEAVVSRPAAVGRVESAAWLKRIEQLCV